MSQLPFLDRCINHIRLMLRNNGRLYHFYLVVNCEANLLYFLLRVVLQLIFCSIYS